MLLENARNDVVKYCAMLLTHQLTKGTGGNISVLDRETGYVAISPSGVPYDVMTAKDVVVVDLQGNVVESELKPSSEMWLHLATYAVRSDMAAIVHTHSSFATAVACTGRDLPAVSYLIALSGMDHVPCVPYYPFGSRELADATAAAFANERDLKAVLLANHGLVAGSGNIGAAFAVAEEMEFVSEMYYRASLLGNIKILSHEEIAVTLERMKGYGQEK